MEQAKRGRQDTSVYQTNEYFRQHMAIDWPAVYRRIVCPVLILQGERDENIIAAKAIDVALAISAEGNRRVAIRVFPDLSHFFTPSRLDNSVTGERRGIVSPLVLDAIQQWLSATIGVKNDALKRE
jgi:pimeloyl-ACP methyl ester carboxylesterase